MKVRGLQEFQTGVLTGGFFQSLPVGNAFGILSRNGAVEKMLALTPALSPSRNDAVE